MPRRLASLALATVVSGCISFSPPAVELRPLSVPAAADALDCALARVAGFGYAVETAEAGVFFNAAKVRSIGSYDVLNVTAAQGTLTVVPSRVRASEEGRYTYEPRASAVSDAEAVVAACGMAPSGSRR